MLYIIDAHPPQVLKGRMIKNNKQFLCFSWSNDTRYASPRKIFHYLRYNAIWRERKHPRRQWKQIASRGMISNERIIRPNQQNFFSLAYQQPLYQQSAFSSSLPSTASCVDLMIVGIIITKPRENGVLFIAAHKDPLFFLSI